MAKQGFPTDPDYIESIHGLYRLHALTISGHDDSDEAQAVRAGLEQPGFRLSTADQTRIRGLSEDLYTLSEPPHAMLSLNQEAQGGLIEALDARRLGDWDRALELLRRYARHLDAAIVSYLRGAIWLEAGDPATAALFFAHANPA
jgi:hypothetical protein